VSRVGDGVLALEQRLPALKDEFLKRAVASLSTAWTLRSPADALETEIVHHFEQDTVGAKIFESAVVCPDGWHSGAVLGLIHVMENLNDPSKLGGGIAMPS